MKYITVLLLVLFVLGLMIPNAFAENVPNWIKNTAGWWATDVISETEFVNAIAYLIKVGIISIESSKSPESIAEMWVNGHISDDEFLANVEYLLEIEGIAIPVNSGLLLDSILIIPTFTRYATAFTNSVSEIVSVAHHPAVFFTQSGTL